MSANNRGLGKGFGSLLPEDFDQSVMLDKQDRVQKIELKDIIPDPAQPRKDFDKDSINELAQSIERYGLLQPLVVTEKDGVFKIVAGERRFRAAKKAGLDRVPVLVRSLKEIERLEVSLIENVQRVDLNPLEQAISIAKLHEQFNISYQDVAKRLGKANTTIKNIVRLLQLPKFAREALAQGRITEGHARSILSVSDPAKQKELMRQIEQNGWSVRQAEQFAAAERTKPSASKPRAGSKPNTLIAVSPKLKTHLSTKWGVKSAVFAKNRGTGRKITLSFNDKTKFEEFIKFLEK